MAAGPYSIRSQLRLKAAVTALFVFISVDTCRGLSCYSCVVSLPSHVTNHTHKLCSEFDWSSAFIVDCPRSTFCRKTTAQLTLPDGKRIQYVARDCAPQSQDTHVLENGTWRMKTFVEGSVYKEGCVKNEDYGVKASTSEDCYCDSNLCNAGQAKHDSTYTTHTDTMAVIFLFSAVKYLHRLR